MAVAAAQLPDDGPRTRPERKLAWLLRFFALLFAVGTVTFLLRPDDTVKNLDWVGSVVRLPTLSDPRTAVLSDFWLTLAVANMATITVCCWLAAGDVRRRRTLVYPVIASKLASSATGILLFVRWAMAFPFVAAALVDLPIAIILIAALRSTPPARS
jgi:hypothetical protein